MSISVRQQGDVTIVDVQGKVTGDGSLARVVQAALDAGTRRVLLNLAGVIMIDSTGIGEIGGVRTSVTSRGGSLKLLVPSAVTSVSGVAQLVPGFEVFGTEREALNSFRV